MRRWFASAALVAMFALQAAAATAIRDPQAFITSVYRSFTASQSAGSDYTPPGDIYTPHLTSLMRAERRRARGEVGCVDFVFWVNGQDWTLTNLAVSTKILSPTRRTVIAKFLNIGAPEEIQFDFRQFAGKWLIADVKSMREPRWQLSELLRCRP